MPHAAQLRTDQVTTSRLILTPIGPDDLTDLLLLYGDPRVAFWTSPWSHEGIEAWTRGMTERWMTDRVGKWMARSRVDGSLVGRGGFTRFDLDGESVFELGWVVRDALTGRGYATEIGRAAIAWAAEHEPATPVIAFTEAPNHASRAVMRHLGMRQASVLRREGLIEGKSGLHPEAPFALYRARLTASATALSPASAARRGEPGPAPAGDRGW